ncbi:MAG TPA: RNA pseudouridine synthase [Desulfobulbaceae bacterium]|nr:RNA pseudouridine synthase [Desulfobulbaceae bacterium]
MRKLVAQEEISLAALLAGSGYSKTKAKQLLKHRAISIGNVTQKRHDQVLLPGDEVCIRTEKEMDEAGKSCPGLTIVHEDESIIVIDKAAGLLTIATEKEKNKTAYYRLTAWLKERSGSARERIFIVHRLDRDTSGLLVFARNETVKRVLQERWQDTEKKYAAIVEGIPRERSGRIASSLRETRSLRVYSVRDSEGGGRPSVTNYQLLQAAGKYALLDITLETGRKNQIRVHLADIGHPVTGDKKYGARTNPVGRLALHACFLAFAHPVTGERLEFQAPLPARFKTLFPGPTGPATGSVPQG